MDARSRQSVILTEIGFSHICQFAGNCGFRTVSQTCLWPVLRASRAHWFFDMVRRVCLCGAGLLTVCGRSEPRAD